MQITGIISEYNPFHNGHKYLIDEHKCRYDSGIIAVMSGDFTQRGEAALADKWTRASLAVHGGADLVLELPYCFTVRSAEHFARGGVQLLQRLGIVNTLCFGSEYADAELIKNLARLQCSASFSDKLREELQNGKSYASSACSALSEISGIAEEILRSPNLILGMEYAKQAYDIQSDSFAFDFDIIKRQAAGHNDADFQGSYASGTAIRRLLYQKRSDFSRLAHVVPPKTAEALCKINESPNSLPDVEHLYLPLIKQLRLAKLSEISSIYGMSEGIEHKLLFAAERADSIAELLALIKSKRYPLTALQRLLLYTLLEITAEQMKVFDENGPLYARVLAFNKTGRQLLRSVKAHSSIPLITKSTAYLNSRQSRRAGLTDLQSMLALDAFAAELYALCFDPIRRFGSDFTTSPLYIEI